MQTDLRGAVIRAFNRRGAVVWSAEYNTFGEARTSVQLICQPLRLRGQYEDIETGLYYNVARYYCPWIKTYLSLDPSWLAYGATNYSYARNSPWEYVDPSGGLPFIIGAMLVGGIVNGLVNAAIAYFGHGSILGAAINGFITGACAVAGAVLAGPYAFVGLVAGGAIGTFFGTLIEGAINGDGWCWSCAGRAMVASIFIDLFLRGASKIPIVRKGLDWLGGQVDDLWKRFRRPGPGRFGNTSVQTLGKGPNSRTLGKNLEAVGVTRPPDSAAHHIVAGKAPGADDAREILEKFGVDINEAANGVFLPKNLGVPNPNAAAVHSNLHTGAYYAEVNELLSQANSRDEVLDTLNYIRNQLLEGPWP